MMTTTGSPIMIITFLLPAVFLAAVLTSSDAAAPAVTRTCPVMTRPISKSLRDCWLDTQSILTTVANKFPVKKDGICLDDAQLLQSNKQLGVELMGTYETIYCFGTVKYKELGNAAIQTINSIHHSISEVIDSPDVCVPDMVFPSKDCYADVNLNDYDTLYQAVLRQLSLLERLSMSLITV